MERVGFLLKVREDKLEEYKKRHQSVWPELLEALRRAGWLNFSLFTTEDGQLFGYFEAEESFQKSLDGIANDEASLRWQEFMAPLFENLTGRPDQSMTPLEHVFYLE